MSIVPRNFTCDMWSLITFDMFDQSQHLLHTLHRLFFCAFQLPSYLYWSKAWYAENIAYLLPSSILKWLHKNSPILIFKMFLTFYCCTITVVPIFPLLCPALPNPTSHIQSFPLLSFSRGALYMFLDDPSPSLPHYPPSPLVTVTFFPYFHVSGYILFAFFSCWLCSS